MNTIDFRLAMYSHFEHVGPGALPAAEEALLDAALAEVAGCPTSRWQLSSYLQGPLTWLHEEAEFRAHVWIGLPEGHPEFPGADRGMVAFVQPVSRNGLYGHVMAEVAWLGQPLPADFEAADDDWVRQMILTQGYLAIPSAEWRHEINGSSTRQLMAWLLARHLEGMQSAAIKEHARS